MKTFTPAHEYAEIFSLHEDDIPELAKRIKANGLREPIVRLDGKALDGRRRERACDRAGVKPVYREFGSRKTDGDDPLEFVIDLNLARRHLGEGERALAAARYATHLNGKPARSAQVSDGEPEHSPTNEEAAGKFKTTNAKVRRAKIIIEGGSKKLIKAVRDGKVTINDASKIAKLPSKAQNVAVAAVLAGTARTVSEVAFPLCERCKEVGKQDGCTACAYLAQCFVDGKKSKTTEPDEVVTDDAGTVVPIRLISVFKARKDYDAALRLLNQTAKACQVIEEGPCKDAKPLEGVYRKYAAVFRQPRKMLVGGKPSLVCPDCGGEGAERCKCSFSPIGGYLTKERADAAGV